MGRRKTDLGSELRILKNLISNMRKFSISSLEYRSRELQISLKLNLTEPVVRTSDNLKVERVEESKIEKSQEREEHPAEGEVVELRSSLVGIFRLSLDPNIPKVKRGDRVRKGQPLGAIDSLNVLNFIRSPVDGKIEDLLVEDGAPVEYGQLLIRIKPSTDKEKTN